ncbi:UPF0223 family protein [Lentibacillus saliphilus]|uniref:UPF0223 family protein n=1 Tax=Lentibacillus saliphilus TaxID=2737028 RepID=UPI001C2F68FA|nr:UPF0223 family protein [Lentibacillus saliphilus]
MNYTYPIDDTWTTEEVVDVIAFYTLVEKAYEKKVDRQSILDAYRTFKNIVPSKSEEKQHFKVFEQASGYSSYHVVKKAREATNDMIQM